MFDRPRPWWVLASFVPFGWLAFAGLLYAGARARMGVALLLAAVFMATNVAGIVIPGDAGGAVIILAWWAGVGASFAIAPAWQRRMISGRLEAERRIAARREARRLVEDEPLVARELGVGRPDVDTAQHHHVVDVNSAPTDVIARMPGVSDALAAEIVRVREEIGGFSSLADLGAMVDLPPGTVAELEERAVFVPRGRYRP